MLARSIVTERERLGISQRELARRAGLRRELVGQIERGKANPSFLRIIQLAGALDIAPDEIGKLLSTQQMEGSLSDESLT